PVLAPPTSAGLPLHAVTQLSIWIYLSIMPQPPPISTLFPYTTLFRSNQLQGALFGARLFCGTLDRVSCRFLPPATSWHENEKRRDRKSTRLNSSHVKISYAVFRLKKKSEATHETEMLEAKVGAQATKD